MNIKLKALLSAAAMSGGLLVATASQAGTIFFDGFESPSTPGISYGGTDAQGATFNDGTGIQQNGSPFGYANAPEGVQTAHIQGTGSFTETVGGLVSGQTYTLSFEDAARAGYAVDPITVSYEPLLETDPTVITTTPASTAFSLVSTNFTYEGFSPEAMFTVAGTNPQTSVDFNSAVDSFQIATVSAVPEPSTWLLMIAGIGGIGLIMRRARKTMGFRFRETFAA